MKNKRAITVISILAPYIFGVLFTLSGFCNFHIIFLLIAESSKGIIKENPINAIPLYAVFVLSLVILLGLFAINIFLIVFTIKNRKSLLNKTSGVIFYVGIAFQIILPIILPILCMLPPLSSLVRLLHSILFKLII